MSNKNKKPRIAIVSLTCCEGCVTSVIDLGERFLELTKRLDIGEFRLVEEMHEGGNYDITFIEGSPVTKDNFKLLKDLRKRSTFLGVLGNCAHMGGVHEIKNYRGVDKVIKKVYKYPETLDNPPIEEVGNVVKIDFEIPGCPINAEEFLDVVYNLLEGRLPKITKNPVCYECQQKGYECLLQPSSDGKRKAQVCFGPITLAGCDAVCLKSKQPCFGCRGMNKDTTALKNFKKLLKNIASEKEIKAQMEVFGFRDEFEEKIKKSSDKK